MELIVNKIIQITIALAFLLIFTECETQKEIPKPVLKSVEPSKGLIGDPVTVKGDNLGNTISVSFNNNMSLITQNTNSEFLSVVPSGASVGVNKLKVETDGGPSNELDFEVIKTPANVDSFPPVIEKTIPSATFIDYPVLIYGTNLSGIIEISFNDKAATIFTNNQRVVTTTVPKGLPSGNVLIKLKTMKGTSSFNIQIQGPPPNGVIPVNFSVINIPPPNYVQGISNEWSCGFFSELGGDRTFVDLYTSDGNGYYSVTGRYEYRFDKNKNYNSLNYVEFTNNETGETLAGQFSSKFESPCIKKMVLISSKSGKISYCTFDLRNNFPDIQCDE